MYILGRLDKNKPIIILILVIEHHHSMAEVEHEALIPELYL